MQDARDRMGKHVSAAIRDARECQDICQQTVQHCLRVGGVHAEARHIRALFDCSELCGLAASFMARTSDLHSNVCTVCASACQRCAESCRRMGDDPEMGACAGACERCAEACKAMATSG